MTNVSAPDLDGIFEYRGNHRLGIIGSELDSAPSQLERERIIRIFEPHKADTHQSVMPVYPALYAPQPFTDLLSALECLHHGLIELGLDEMREAFTGEPPPEVRGFIHWDHHPKWILNSVARIWS
ncbi:hypothetical protein [Methylobacterium sp. Leaf85]|uniref:hypothetical protein n=1 Tax=Methylobacterium sp. Leaf85 TaxID=1736241 RepID=UPI0012E94494|nr:hypothetical protein [Methylobacterium sp. Leaf85]